MTTLGPPNKPLEGELDLYRDFSVKVFSPDETNRILSPDEGEKILYDSFCLEAAAGIQRKHHFCKSSRNCRLYPIPYNPEDPKSLERVVTILLDPSRPYFTGLQTCDSSTCVFCSLRKKYLRAEQLRNGVIGGKSLGWQIVMVTNTIERSNDCDYQVEQLQRGHGANQDYLRYELVTKRKNRLERLRRESRYLEFFREELEFSGEWFEERREEAKKVYEERGLTGQSLMDEIQKAIVRKGLSEYRRILIQEFEESEDWTVRLEAKFYAKEYLKGFRAKIKEECVLSRDSEELIQIESDGQFVYCGGVDSTFKQNWKLGVFHNHLHMAYAFKKHRSIQELQELFSTAWCKVTTGIVSCQHVQEVREDKSLSEYIADFTGIGFEISNMVRKKGLAKDSMSLIQLLMFILDSDRGSKDEKWGIDTYRQYSEAWHNQSFWYPAQGWASLVFEGTAKVEFQEREEKKEEELRRSDEGLEPLPEPQEIDTAALLSIEVPDSWVSYITASQHSVINIAWWSVFGSDEPRPECRVELVKMFKFESYDMDKGFITYMDRISKARERKEELITEDDYRRFREACEQHPMHLYCTERLEVWIKEFKPHNHYRNWRRMRKESRVLYNTTKPNNYIKKE